MRTEAARVPTHRRIAQFEALSDAEKERVWAYYERQPIPPSETRPLNPAERRQWERDKRKPGRPKVGKGAKVISVTVEGGLLDRADAYAKGHGLTRAQLIARGLELAITG